MANEDLLNELKIDSRDREEGDASGRRWPWLIAVVVLLIAAGGWVWWSGARAVEVQTVTASAPAQTEGAGAVLQATGYVTARRKATVSAQIVGKLTAVLIEEGDHVDKGQVLARLDHSAQLAHLNAAKASAKAAEARVAQIRTQLQQARRESRRQQDLVARGLVSTQVAEQARTEVASLKAQLNSAQAQAKAAEAQVAVAQVRFDYTVVRAPFAGVVTQKTAQVGEIIAPSAAGGGFTRTGVGTIVDMDSLEIEVDVNESYIARVEPHMPAEAKLDAYPDWTIPAHVIAIVPTANRAKATVKVRVAMDERDPRIVPNMGVRVTFLSKASPSATETDTPDGVLVPASAIVERDGQPVVFVVEGGVAHRRQVTTGAHAFGDLRLVTEGLGAGTEIVAEPPTELADGARLRTVAR